MQTQGTVAAVAADVEAAATLIPVTAMAAANMGMAAMATAVDMPAAIWRLGTRHRVMPAAMRLQATAAAMWRLAMARRATVLPERAWEFLKEQPEWESVLVPAACKQGL